MVGFCWSILHLSTYGEVMTDGFRWRINWKKKWIKIMMMNIYWDSTFFPHIKYAPERMEFQFWWIFFVLLLLLINRTVLGVVKKEHVSGIYLDVRERKILNNKYQHEITNHLNTAAYDTNGVINPTERQYTTDTHQNLEQTIIKKKTLWAHTTSDRTEKDTNEINLQHNKFLSSIFMWKHFRPINHNRPENSRGKDTETDLYACGR